MYGALTSARTNLSGPEPLRLHQRALVELLLSAAVSPPGGWESHTDPMSMYVLKSFEVHVSEALLDNPAEDTKVVEWLGGITADKLW